MDTSAGVVQSLEAQYEVQGRLFLVFVIRKDTPILKLLTNENEMICNDVMAGRAIRLAPALLCRRRPSIVLPCHMLPADTGLCEACCLACSFGGL